MLTSFNIGICAYNEEENIGRLLNNLLTNQGLPKNSEIAVICSGCTDSTPEVVKKFCKRDPRVKLIHEGERRGKAAALNILFIRASNSPEALILMNADGLPEPGSINKLVIQLLGDEKIGAAVGRPIPINEKKGLPNLITHLIWDLHHMTSYKSVKMSAELCAIRPKLIKQIPVNLATDEPYMQFLIQRQGYKIIYVPEAIVNIKGPDNFKELLKQRRRICTGHLQIKKMTGFAVPTAKYKNVLPTLLKRSNPWKPIEELITILVGALLEMCARLLARYDLSKGRVPYIWERLESTKNLDLRSGTRS